MRLKYRNRQYLVWIVFPLLLFLLLGCSQESESSPRETPAPPQEQGEWVPVQRKTLRHFIPAVGTLQARQITQIGSQVSGRVQEVLVDVGDIVHKGQVLVRLDPTFFQIEVAQRKADVAAARAHLDAIKQSVKTAQADVKRAQVALEDAALQLARMKELWERPAGEKPYVQKQQYDQAVFKHQQAMANLEAAQARLQEVQARWQEASFRLQQAQSALRYAEERLRETEIRAPYDAVVSKRLVDPGEPVVSGAMVTHLLEVQDIRVLELEFSLPQEFLAQVQPGTPVMFRIEGIEEGRGKIDTVFPALDETTRSFRCRVLIDNADRRLRPGLLVQVQVVQEATDVLAVPRQALSQTASGWQVVVDEDGTPTPRRVEVGLLTQEEAEIREGLQEGERVWIAGSRGEG
ncbi:MAG: efflux RND transporter periplasmic adaptor subunit [Nitrospinota bacterium]|nr:MAG: efflux RND transporter periplasmic adaptor subunit [Nitrospinota bacterium]